jgi:hypothetical protein
MHSIQEVKEWLQANRRWRITRNGRNWDGGKIENGDHFRWKDGIRQEREVTCIDPDGQEFEYPLDQAKSWASRFKDCIITRNGLRWDGEDLDPGDTLEARIRTAFGGKGLGKTSKKGLWIADPLPAEKLYTIGPQRYEVDKEELLDWLKANERWVISRNGDPWNYQTIEPGDHFQFPEEER